MVRRLSKIDVGQSVFFQQTEGQNWNLGKVTDVLGPNTYQICCPSGGTYRRNHVHMRPTSIAPNFRDLYPVVQPRVLDVAPSTPPEGAPQASNPSKDPPVEDSQPCSANKNITPTNSPERSLSANRPRREI